MPDTPEEQPPGPATGGSGTGTAVATRTDDAGNGARSRRVLTVIRSGSVKQVRSADQDKVHTWPNLLVIEFAALLTLLVLVIIMGALVQAPLKGLADPNQTPNPSKAPWYFSGLQEMLTMWHPMVAGVLLPGIAVLGLMAAPYIDRNPSHRPLDRKFAISLFTLFLLMWAVLVISGSFFRGPGFNFVFPWRNGIYFDL